MRATSSKGYKKRAGAFRATHSLTDCPDANANANANANADANANANANAGANRD